MTGALPWERQPGETGRAFRGFCCYLNLGVGRSIAKAATADGGGTGKRRRFEKWSVKWRWVQRAEYYDDALEAEERARNEAYRRKMNERHRATGAAALGKVVEWLQNVQGANLRPLEAARLMEVAAKLERLAVGEPTEIGTTERAGNVRVGPDYSKMSDEELREEAITSLVGAGLCRENAVLVVDEMAGVKRGKQRTFSESESSTPSRGGEREPAEG